MFRAASLASAQAGSAFAPYKFDKWKMKGQRMTGLLLRIQYPISITGGGWTPPALAALLVAVLTAAISSFTLSYGTGGQFKPWVAVTAAEVRNAHRFVTQRECPNNLPTANTAIGNYTWNIDLLVPFAVATLKNGRKPCPGYSQIRTMQIEMIEGTAYNNVNGGTAARQAGGQLVIDIDPLCVKGDDQWTTLLSYYKANTSDFEAVGPDGTHLAAWEDNAGFAGTAIALYSLYFNGNDYIHTETMPAYAADDRYIDEWVQGGAAIDDTETIVYSPEIMQAREDLPHGRISLKLPAMYVPTIKLRGLYWPVMSTAEANEAAIVASDQQRTGVVVSVDPDATDLSELAARTLPMSISTTADLGFTMNPGIIVEGVGVTPKISIPPHLKQQVGAVVANAASSGPSSAQAAEAKALVNLAKLVPGAAAVAAGAANAATAARSQVIRDHFRRTGAVEI